MSTYQILRSRNLHPIGQSVTLFFQQWCHDSLGWFHVISPSLKKGTQGYEWSKKTTPAGFHFRGDDLESMRSQSLTAPAAAKDLMSSQMNVHTRIPHQRKSAMVHHSVQLECTCVVLQHRCIRPLNPQTITSAAVSERPSDLTKIILTLLGTKPAARSTFRSLPDLRKPSGKRRSA